ncbi:hypothetical protein OF83DRAFT_1088657 [Amylostereum chailletii]|nr:hypothetical protein OF83DRAFT_1088657 [Amylostereum chailletii]
MSTPASPKESPPAQPSSKRSIEKRSADIRPPKGDPAQRRNQHVLTASAQVPSVSTTSTPSTNGHTGGGRSNGRTQQVEHHGPKPAQDPYPGLRALLSRTQEDLANVTSELDASKGTIQRLSDDRRALEDLQRELKQAKQTISERDREIAHLKREKKDVAELLERRTLELNAALAFFPASETVTDTQAMDFVKELNYEIMQVATALVDSYEPAMRIVPPPAIAKPCSRVLQAEGALGDTILQRLTPTRVAKGDANFSIWFQAALQSSIAWIVRWVAVQWHLGPQEKLGIFDGIWDALHQAGQSHSVLLIPLLSSPIPEAAPVAIKWSTITRKYARQVLDWKRTDQYVTQLIAERIAYVVVFCGYEPTAGDRKAAATLVLSKVERQVSEVARLAIKFNETIGQKFPSYTVEPLMISAGTSFDPSTMASEFKDGKDGAQDEEKEKTSCVVCTAELGLRRAVEGGNSHQILVKPKVVLDKQH